MAAAAAVRWEVDLPETRVSLGPGGEMRSMEQVERYNAHRVIEELMITANVATARFLGRARMPALYRVHSPPDADGFEELRHLYSGAGHSLSEAAARNPDEINQALRALRRSACVRGDRRGYAQVHAAGLLPAGQYRSLRPGAEVLHALHVADSPLPRPAGAPRDKAPDRRRPRRGSAAARQ